MKTRGNTDNAAIGNAEGQRGSALVIALFILALISVFVAMALSRTAAEAAAVGNETAEARTLYAAQGSLEMMTRNFNKVFETKLNPAEKDLNRVKTGSVPGLEDYAFLQELDRTSDNEVLVLTGGPYSGLYAIRDNWRLRTTATDKSGSQVMLTRNVLNNRVPIFQFGVFYEDDLELFNGPTFSFGGRVHSNKNFFLHPSSNGAYFDSRVTSSSHIVTQVKKNGDMPNLTTAKIWVKNASGVYKQLLPDQGSVLNTTTKTAPTNVFASEPELPPSRLNSNWTTQSSIFDGNLQSQTKPLKLPLNIGASNDLVEMIKRPKEVAKTTGGDLYSDNSDVLAPVTDITQDTDILRSERFANKTGIRITLADSKAKLPGCASGIGTAAVTFTCGVRLDGNIDGLGGDRGAAVATPFPSPISSTLQAQINASSRGYQPKPMKSVSTGNTWNYIPTRVNGERLFTGNQVWIKVETVETNDATGAIITKDITQDFLAMGVTEQAPTSIDIANYNETPLTSSLTATTPQAVTSANDSRSVIKLQRFTIDGPAIPGGNNVKISYGSGSTATNVVRRWSGATDSGINAGCTTGCGTPGNTTPDTISPNTSIQSREQYGHLKRATVNGVSNEAIVPFPIKMFDTREGEHYDERSSTYYTDLNRLTRNGVMSLIDIDIANLRRFLRGDFNGMFPTDTPFALAKGSSLLNSDIPQKEGWVLYISDRRGDFDFDGEFDMEDVYGANLGNDGVLQFGEDVNGNGKLDVRYGTEAERYNTNIIFPDVAAVYDHKYFRRGIRLINGTYIPGIYDSTAPGNTRGFTVASENGIYVQGNYNTTGVASVPSTGNTPFSDYLPYNTVLHIPASIVGDAVTILSNAWNDGQSFSSPYNHANRTASTTQMRFAMISGDTVTSKEATPHQGGTDPRLNGGLHNFKRFLEHWGGQRLDYTGSLINLFNSQVSNGTFKCCNTVYSPPTRNWVFDSTFLDPTRLPPGTPFFQYVQTTGFERATY